ncbi:monosaccharide-transporting ATPase [Paenibacillus vortex V453]|jgi:rhamnose transport system permease protein|uniref:Autoinducer 2 import system permease protein LsrD n=2 Tax=Paenibacillus TaxID=44249 RepID=A0A163F5S2_9BACL|nr:MULTISPECIES: ABC transporter permease [Paenibacillus]ANA78774.1 branched-chain amino acid ABC transporter permease [Paenibacillus glucanolyticus]AVV57313.1 ABC transporter permease [Paenibacillus glucanolyticus]EFU39231.1 monosaccharide-transporting ATPase [Paenibacillus vortex V453]ETT35484.1 monosaccharide-transporting ATPase [Paenibacillus sp. FSL R5-808]KZS44178.1 branched-chain amino acid ABC transporter permease [Paenibacillus glucanolyticus]
METRVLIHKQDFSWKRFFLQWEWMLVLLFIAIHVMNMNLSEYYWDSANLRDATMGFLDKAFIVLPMVFIMILGDIDISVASIIALSSTVMADLYNHGVPMSFAMLVCLGVGILCGFINGLLIVKFKELSAVIVTLSTMIIYRGIAYIMLEDQAAGSFPEWFSFLGWGYVGPIPFILIVFAIFAAGFGWLLHKTKFGRSVYAMGSNSTASRFSGIQVNKIKMMVFTLTGLMSAIAALFLASRMGSTRPNVATGYELDVIAMVVLGGISTAGGKGRMIGAILAIFLIGFLRYGLGLVNVQAQVLLVIIGLLLIVAVAVPKLKFGKGLSRKG